MALSNTSLRAYLSVKTGAAGNSTAQGDANLSLGKWLSTTAAPSALNAWFDAATPARNAAGEVDYRCGFVRNLDATLTALTYKLWMQGGDPAGGPTWAIALDTTAASPIGSASAQALEIANDTTAPAGLTWVTPTTEGTGLPFGDIPPGDCRPFWVRRTQTNTTASTEWIYLHHGFDTLG